MRILIAMDSFKGSLDAMAACAAVARGARRAAPYASLDLCPLADGGEGTAAVLHAILHGRSAGRADGGGSRLSWVEADVSGPLPGDRVKAAYLWIAGERPTAVVELAAASGLTLVPRDRLDPLRATTHGTGELVRHAIDRGARRVWLALGGSATVDGGVGMAMALGWRFLDTEGRSIGLGGGELERIAAIEPPPGHRPDPPGVSKRVRVTALRDVENLLLGEQGAARVFGPQKGATPAAVARLEHGLDRLAGVIERDLGVDVRRLRGGGSAGGAGAGAAAFLGARLAGGARLVLRLSRFDARLRDVDLVITGEGRLDSQSLQGKVVGAVARAAAKCGVPVAAVAGRVTLDEEVARAHGIGALEAAASPGIGDAEAMAGAEPLLEAAAQHLVAKLWH